MIDAFLFGALAQSPLILGGLIVYWFKVPTKIVGWLAGLGAGAMVSAIAYNLIIQAKAAGPAVVVTGLLIGAGVFVGLDYLVEKRFGEAAGALGIVLGAIIDGVPESVIFGVQIASGSAISPAFLTAVMVSNIPQSMAPSADLREQGQTWARTALMWLGVVIICGLTAGVTWLAATTFSGVTGDFASAFAAGGLLAMLIDSLIPFGFERGGLLTGIWGVVGFALSILQQ
jgi:zinc transporter, ZIP family